MKETEILENENVFDSDYLSHNRHININEVIKELEDLQKEKDLLEEYVQFARLHIETYRCKCGSLGRVGYLCSNKECSEV